jgi:hypothetical protein
VHHLGRRMNVPVKYASVASFERDYRRYDLSRIDTLRGADMLIMRIGENVRTRRGFIEHYDKLIRRMNAKVVVIVGGFWPGGVNDEIEDYAKEKGFPFIRLDDLYEDKTNLATNFSNKFVARHPSDKGMRLIADRVWEYTGRYFKKEKRVPLPAL